MAIVGDLVQVPSAKVGQAPREGEVVAVTGSLLRIRWSTGEESTIMPAMGSLVVVGKAKSRGRAGGSKAPAKSTTKAAAKKVGPPPARKVAANKAAAKKTTAAAKGKRRK